MKRWDVKVCATVEAETAGEAYAAAAEQLLSIARMRADGQMNGLIPLESEDPVKSLEVNAFPR